MNQAAVVYKSYHPWSWYSTSSLVLNHGWSKKCPYDSCTQSTAELQPVEPISSFRQKEKKTKKKTSKSCMSLRMGCEKNGVWAA